MIEMLGLNTGLREMMTMNALFRQMLHAVVFLLASVCTIVFAAEEKANIVDELTVWYAAHGDGFQKDAALDAVNAALAPDVNIELKAFDVVQNKSGYLESFDGWRDTVEGGLVAHRVDSIDGLSASTTVCYVFVGNSSLNREMFTFNDDLQIVAFMSEELADNCEAF